VLFKQENPLARKPFLPEMACFCWGEKAFLADLIAKGPR
jgi:hypothetical protein